MSSTPPPVGVLDRLRALIDTVYREIVKFGIVGAVAFVVDLGSFNLLRQTLLSARPSTATLVSAGIATIVAWVGNRMWTFRHRRNRPMAQEGLMFLGVNGLAMIIQVLIVAFVHYVLLWQSVAADNGAKITGIAVGTLFRYVTYRYIVFAGPLADPTAAIPDPVAPDPVTPDPVAPDPVEPGLGAQDVDAERKSAN